MKKLKMKKFSNTIISFFLGLTIQKWKNFKHLFLFFVLLFKKYFGKWKFSFSIFENYKSSQVYKNANFHIGTCKQWNNNTDWLDHILSVGFLRLWKQRRIVLFWDCPPPSTTANHDDIRSYLNVANFPAAISGGINKNFNYFPLCCYKLVLDFPLPSLELPVVDNYFQKLHGEPIGLLKSPLGSSYVLKTKFSIINHHPVTLKKYLLQIWCNIWKKSKKKKITYLC